MYVYIYRYIYMYVCMYIRETKFTSETRRLTKEECVVVTDEGGAPPTFRV